MAKPSFSENWFRVAGLKPRLRAHVRLHRQVFRRQVWHVVQDDESGRHHRLAPAANHMIGLMDGRRTVDEIWRAAAVWAGGDGDPPTQDETISLLAQLHRADLLASDAPADIDELAHRSGRQARSALMARLKNPLAIRLPLCDPDRFLTATLPLVGWIFSWVGVALWLVVVGAGAAVTALNWPELTTGVADRVLLTENLLLLALVYPVVKALHELGHGYAVKKWGGEMREMGLMILVLMPVPYVDASAAAGFRSKWRRAAVGAAGILVELFVAAAAMIVWVSVEPGLIRAAAFNAALIGGVSTLLFNGNPLLRFDGYYVLADLVEIPNLGQRANRHFIHVLKRWVFGLRASVSPATAPGEATWFFCYAVAAFAYRLAIFVGIAIFLAQYAPVLGVALAVLSLATTIVIPLGKALWWLLDAPELRGRRRRALLTSAGTAAVLVGALFAAPLPYATAADGVIALADENVLNIEGQGFVVAVHPGGPVAAGAQLLRLEDETLGPRRALVAAGREELRLRLEREIGFDAAEAAILREQLTGSDAELARLDELSADLTLRAPHAGRFLAAHAVNLEGRHLTRGARLGYVVPDAPARISVAVPQDRIDLVRRRLHGVQVTLAGRPDAATPATLLGVAPKASFTLPSAALGAAGGGGVSLDPAAGDGLTALEAQFLVDLAAPLPLSDILPGRRVKVRFDHGREPIAWRIGRALRQLFLREFDV